MNEDDAWDEEFFVRDEESVEQILVTDSPPRKSILARVTPLDDMGRPGAAWAVVVVEIDERTIAFNHLVPLTARNVIVTFEKRGMSTHSVEVELTWCRFDHPHRYTSGGRFILPLGRTA
jgi:hypothetical protein